MSNPFEGKFKTFSGNLSAQNAQNRVANITQKSGAIFKDKPFTDEFSSVYKVAQVGATVAQVVTFLTTAALGVFALQHVIPLSFGIYIAVPLGLLFAFGIEKVKRSTLAIAAKHFLKYKEFGFVGVVALLTLLVSIGAALYGAKELPGIVYPKVGRVTDTKNVEALTNDLNRVQGDIDRTAGQLAQGKNWVAENRTLPRLQKERAALVERRTIAAKEAEQKADEGRQEAEAERVAKVEKMKMYSVGTAIFAELIFALCTIFIFYFLWRAFAEVNADESTEVEPGEQPKRQGIRYTATANLTTDENRLTKIVNDVPLQGKNRLCENCKTPYIYAHSKQMYCSEKCRVDAWENRTGAKLKHKKSV